MLSNDQTLMGYALSKGLADFKDISELVSFFKYSVARYDVEKIWLVYVWIAENIAYDIDSLKMKKIGKIDPPEVLRDGKCICQGYSLLFKYLCEQLGFECIKISGFTKGSDFSVTKNFSGSDHAWNAVKIDNRWEYVDCTWGVGYVEKHCGLIRFVKKFQPIYFLTPPQIFIYDHFSENYQLQTPRITLSEFRVLPRITVNFHMYEFESLTHNKAEIHTNTSRFKLEFKCPTTTVLTANLKDTSGNKAEDAVFLGRNPLTSNYEIVVAIPEAHKQYVLNLYAKLANTLTNYYDEIGKYLIQTSCDTLFEPEYFVQRLYQTKVDAFLYSPIDLNLKLYNVYTFRIYVKDALKVALVDSESSWFYFAKCSFNKDIWHMSYTCEVFGRLNLFAKMDEKGGFCGIYSYNVVF